MKLQKLSGESIPKDIVGWWEIPEDLYHAGPAYGSSSVRNALRSPAHVKVKVEPTKAMKLGSAVHRAVLEPERFESEYVVKPAGVDLRTKEGKQWASDNAGRSIVAVEEMKIIEAIKARLNASKTWQFISGSSYAETCLYGEMGGVHVKGRMDVMTVTHERVEIIDLKTCQDAGKAFQRSVIDQGRAIQAALYVDLAYKLFKRPTSFIWVAAETEEPHGVAFYKADEPTLAYGRAKVMTALGVLAKAEIEGWDKVYPDELQTMTLPRWAEAELLSEVF